MIYSDKKFFLITIFIISLLFVFFAAFNYIVDYQNFFSKKNIVEKELKNISNQVNSNNFRNYDNYSHRDIKRALALFSEKDDCFILGSSQHIIISSENLFNLDINCKNNTNLSLPGGSLEDILINTYFLSLRENKVKKIFLGIGPYTFKYNTDYQLRWKKFENIFIKMNNEKIINKKNIIQDAKEVIKILYDKKFLIKNIESVKNKFFNLNIKIDNNSFEGIKINNDGSYKFFGDYELQDGELISKVKNARWGFDELNFEIGPKETLINNIKFIKSLGIDVDIILVPFHPFVFSSNDWIVEKIVIADNEIQKISKEMKIKIHGSFFPYDLSCFNIDFYDDSHPRKTCIEKIMR